MATTTVRKLQLGIELRRLREAAGRTPAQAARELNCTTAKISRLELGQSGVSMGDLRLLLQFYDTDAEHLAELVELSRDNRRRGRWTGDRATMPEWFRTFFDLESDAEDIRIVETDIVPGLFQTEAYMRTLYEAAAPFGGPDDIDAAVRSRQERQSILDRADPPTVSCVLSESCVRRVVGGREVMAEQLARLVELSARPRVQLQLWPFDGEIGAGVGARPFRMVRIPAPRADGGLTFAYCEAVDGGRCVDEPAQVRRYEAVWGAHQAAALGPVETRSRLRLITEQYTEG